MEGRPAELLLMSTKWVPIFWGAGWVAWRVLSVRLRGHGSGIRGSVPLPVQALSSLSLSETSTLGPVANRPSPRAQRGAGLVMPTRSPERPTAGTSCRPSLVGGTVLTLQRPPASGKTSRRANTESPTGPAQRASRLCLQRMRYGASSAPSASILCYGTPA